MEVRIGVDPHKASHTAVIMNGTGEVLDTRRFASTAQGFAATHRWAKRFPERSWAIEGAGGLGLRLAQALIAQGEVVHDAPALFAARVRTLSVGHGRKNDAADARAVARVAWGDQPLHRVTAEGDHTTLRLLSERRGQMVTARIALVNQLHHLLRDLGLSAPRQLKLAKATALLSSIRPAEGPARVRKELARDLVGEIRQVDRRIAALDERVKEAVSASGTRLTELRGVGPVLAGRILAEVGDVRRFPNAAHFASYSGTAPIEVSSGEVVRHRLSRAGNRQLNSNLHLMAVTQLSRPSAGREYFDRKVGEGKSKKEAMRCLKRRLSDVVYRTLSADAAAALPGEAKGERRVGQTASRVVGSHPHTDASRSAIPGRGDHTRELADLRS